MRRQTGLLPKIDATGLLLKNARATLLKNVRDDRACEERIADASARVLPRRVLQG